MSFDNFHQYWVCDECGLHIMSMPGEKGPKHCPRCYNTVGDVVELNKVSAGL